MFVVNDHNVVETRAVKWRQKKDGLLDVTEGLTAQDWVIKSFSAFLQPGMTVQPQKVVAPTRRNRRIAERVGRQRITTPADRLPPAVAPAAPV